MSISKFIVQYRIQSCPSYTLHLKNKFQRYENTYKHELCDTFLLSFLCFQMTQSSSPLKQILFLPSSIGVLGRERYHETFPRSTRRLVGQDSADNHYDVYGNDGGKVQMVWVQQSLKNKNGMIWKFETFN